MIGALAVSEEALEAAHICPETRLFRHIILNAVLDAIYGSCMTRENSEQIKAEALRWFVNGGRDFETICECANLHPDQVRKDAIAYIHIQRDSLPLKATRPRLHNSPSNPRLAA